MIETRIPRCTYFPGSCKQWRYHITVRRSFLDPAAMEVSWNSGHAPCSRNVVLRAQPGAEMHGHNPGKEQQRVKKSLIGYIRFRELTAGKGGRSSEGTWKAAYPGSTLHGNTASARNILRSGCIYGIMSTITDDRMQGQLQICHSTTWNTATKA